MCAYADAKGITQGDERSNEQILPRLYRNRESYGNTEGRNGEKLGETLLVETLITMIFDGASDTVNYQLEQLMPQCNYYRFQPQLTFGQDEMDDVSRVNLLSLKALASTFIETEKCALDTISQRLVENQCLDL